MLPALRSKSEVTALLGVRVPGQEVEGAEAGVPVDVEVAAREVPVLADGLRRSWASNRWSPSPATAPCSGRPAASRRPAGTPASGACRTSSAGGGYGPLSWRRSVVCLDLVLAVGREPGGGRLVDLVVGVIQRRDRRRGCPPVPSAGGPGSCDSGSRRCRSPPGSELSYEPSHSSYRPETRPVRVSPKIGPLTSPMTRCLPRLPASTSALGLEYVARASW